MSSSTQFMEHRWGTRVELDAPADLLTADGRLASVVVRNASLSGAFVTTAAKLPLLSRVSLRPVAGAGDWLDACVVRVDTTGLALEWLDPGLHEISALLALRREPALAAAPRRERAAPRGSVAWIPQERLQPPRLQL